MSSLSLHLNRNLRRQVLRGHPWIYRQNLKEGPSASGAALAKVFDHQNEFLCWAIYDSQSPLALRVLSTSPQFNEKTIDEKLTNAFNLRRRFPSDATTAYRLINGEGDFLPGLVCDIYNNSAVIQYDGSGPESFWQRFPISKRIIDHTKVESVFIKFRGKEKPLQKLVGLGTDTSPIAKENNTLFKIDIEFGQKTGFFLDQRENRKYITNHVRDRSVLNLFSYTGGFSIYAGRGGAAKVTSVDISEKAIALANENWALNKLDSAKHSCVQADVFDYVSNANERFDFIIVDPPSMAPNEASKEAATQKYIDVFAKAAKKVSANGDLVLSSCSSHITFQDFFDIASEAISKARRCAQVALVSGQGFDHPFPLACPELRYLKFLHLKLD